MAAIVATLTLLSTSLAGLAAPAGARDAVPLPTTAPVTTSMQVTNTTGPTFGGAGTPLAVSSDGTVVYYRTGTGAASTLWHQRAGHAATPIVVPQLCPTGTTATTPTEVAGLQVDTTGTRGAARITQDCSFTNLEGATMVVNGSALARVAGGTVTYLQVPSVDGNWDQHVRAATFDLSADGRWVAFSSDNPALWPGDANGLDDAFVLDLDSTDQAPMLISVGSGGWQTPDTVRDVKISADGRYVAWSLGVPYGPGEESVVNVDDVISIGVYITDRDRDGDGTFDEYDDHRVAPVPLPVQDYYTSGYYRSWFSLEGFTPGPALSFHAYTTKTGGYPTRARYTWHVDDGATYAFAAGPKSTSDDVIGALSPTGQFMGACTDGYMYIDTKTVWLLDFDPDGNGRSDSLHQGIVDRQAKTRQNCRTAPVAGDGLLVSAAESFFDDPAHDHTVDDLFVTRAPQATGGTAPGQPVVTLAPVWRSSHPYWTVPHDTAQTRALGVNVVRLDAVATAGAELQSALQLYAAGAAASGNVILAASVQAKAIAAGSAVTALRTQQAAYQTILTELQCRGRLGQVCDSAAIDAQATTDGLLVGMITWSAKSQVTSRQDSTDTTVADISGGITCGEFNSIRDVLSGMMYTGAANKILEFIGIHSSEQLAAIEARGDAISARVVTGTSMLGRARAEAGLTDNGCGDADASQLWDLFVGPALTDPAGHALSFIPADVTTTAVAPQLVNVGAGPDGGATVHVIGPQTGQADFEVTATVAGMTMQPEPLVGDDVAVRFPHLPPGETVTFRVTSPDGGAEAVTVTATLPAAVAAPLHVRHGLDVTGSTYLAHITGPKGPHDALELVWADTRAGLEHPDADRVLLAPGTAKYVFPPELATTPVFLAVRAHRGDLASPLAHSTDMFTPRWSAVTGTPGADGLLTDPDRIAVTVRDVSDNIAVGNVSLFVDGELRDQARGAGTHTLTTPTQDLADGTHHVTVTVTDAHDNTVTVTAFDVIVDNTAPVMDLTAPVDGRFSPSAVQVEGLFDDGDGVGIAQVTLHSNRHRYNNGITATRPAPIPDTFTMYAGSTAGDTTLTFTVTDRYGRATSVERDVFIDPAAPVVTAAIGGWDRSIVDIDVTATDAHTNVMSLRLSGADGTTLDEIAGQTATFSIDTTGWADTTYPMTVTATDSAGNSATATVAVVVEADVTGPDLVVEDLSVTEGGWLRGEGLLSIYAVDDRSPVLLTVEADGVPLPATDIGHGGWNVPFTLGDGTHQITVTATDHAGNTTTETVDVAVDRTGPDMAVTAPDRVDANDPVTITVDATDVHSGLSTIVLLGPHGPIVADHTRDGQAVFTVDATVFATDTILFDAHAIDIAGNRSARPVTVHVDPTVTVATETGQRSWFQPGAPDHRLACDVDGNGRDEVVYVTGQDWRTRLSTTTGPHDWAVTTPLLETGDIVVCGDWDGDGTDTPGLVRDGTWILFEDPADGPVRTVDFGRPGSVPVAGDWDGDGTDTPGDVLNGGWRLANSWDSRRPDHTFRLAVTDTTVVVGGDWDGDGRDEVATATPGPDAWSWTTRAGTDRNAVTTTVEFGNPAWQPLTGRFGTDGIDRFGTAR